MKKELSLTHVSILMAIILVALLSLIASIGNSDNLFWLIICMLLLNVMYATDNLDKRKTFLFFNITFFTFLVGMLLFQKIEGNVLLSSYRDDTKTKVIIYMAISLFMLRIGHSFGEKHRKKAISNQEELSERDYLFRYSSTIKLITILFYITYPFSLLYAIDKASFVSSNSYLAYYTSYVISIPYFLVKIGELNQISFAMLFCLEYRKQRLIAPSVLYAVTSVFSLGMGQRNAFVLDIIMFIILISYANTKSLKYTGNRIYTRKMLIVVAVAIPFIIIFLEYWGYARIGQKSTMSIWGSFKNFFSTQGSQVNFFADTIEIKDQIWKQTVPYTFSSPYNYIRNLFRLKNYSVYTYENAMYGNSLGATQFYITSPGSLLSGKGSGCCYLSELFFDFGTLGILLGSMFLGYIMSNLYLDETKPFWKNAFIVLVIRNIIYIPRASYFDWLSVPFNIWNITFVFIVIIFLKRGKILLWNHKRTL